MNQAKRHNKNNPKAVRLIAVAGVVLFLLGACIVAMAQPAFGKLLTAPWATSVAERCTVGMQGYAVSMTVVGAGAATVCDQWLRERGDEVYLATDSRNEPVICEHDVDGRRIIVRDVNMALLGREICRRADAAMKSGSGARP